MYMCMYICMYVCCTHEEWKYNFSQKGVMKNKYNCKETSKTYHCITNFLLNSGSEKRKETIGSILSKGKVGSV